MDYKYSVSLWGILSRVTGLLQCHLRRFITFLYAFGDVNSWWQGRKPRLLRTLNPLTIVITLYFTVHTFFNRNCLLESTNFVMLENGKKTSPKIDTRQSFHVGYIISYFFHVFSVSIFHYFRDFISWMINAINVTEYIYS